MQTPRSPRMRPALQYATGFALGLALAALAVDHGRQHAPRATAPVLSVLLTQD